jgi:2-succinyl-5-enolpyruvyl-6-hydroxy-3-cyclohexene-1-carboxylate synthase
VSTAIGVAMAVGGPTVALVGDLAFLHDVSALVGGEGTDTGPTVVVADNRGGGIFSFLPPASALPRGTFEMLFGTPQAPDVTEVAAGFGWPVDEVADHAGAGRLEEVLAARVGSGSRSVVRVQLPDRTANADGHGELNEAIADAVDRSGERRPGRAGEPGTRVGG